MAKFTSRAIPVFVALAMIILNSQVSAQADHSLHKGHCEEAKCGPNAQCNSQTQECICPGVQGKDYVKIPAANPICQKVARKGESCSYNEQCTQGLGPSSRCHEKKCECFDKQEETRYYNGQCYIATTLGVKCSNLAQCKASIAPEDQVECYANSTLGGERYCQCKDGQHCHEKSFNGGAPLQTTFVLALVGLLAVKVVL